METDRRRLIGAAVIAAAAGAVTKAEAAPLVVEPDTSADQTDALQRAIDRASQTRSPLILAPGTYRSGLLTLRDGTHLVGARGATRIVFTGHGPSLIASENANLISLSGLTFDGDSKPLPERRGLLHHLRGSDVRIAQCDILASGGTGIWLEEIAGDIRNNSFADIATTALVSFNARGLLVAQNTIRGTGDNGIEILRHDKGDDGTLVIDNRIEKIAARAGGSGQHGNGIVVYRAGNVIVRGNRIRDCDYSGVRGNSAANIQISGNSISDGREVAIYSEFSFEGAVISGNTVEGAAIGISVCNFNEGGRLAVVSGNIIRNLLDRRPAGASDGQGGIGIYVEADTSVTGNVIENAPLAGIMAGWGAYLRDVVISANVIRKSGIGIAASADPEAGTTLVNDNVIAESRRGAVMGMDHARVITDDLTSKDAPRLPQIVIGTNHRR